MRFDTRGHPKYVWDRPGNKAVGPEAPLNIAILSDQHFPCNGADTEVLVNTAAALGAAGAKVSLVVPSLPRRTAEDVLAYYGVPATFELVAVPGWPWPERTFRIEKLTHGVVSAFGGAARRADVIHTRNLLPLIGAHLQRARWSFETYRRFAEEKPWLPLVLRHLDLTRGIGAVVHSEAARRDIIRLGLAPHAVVLAKPGVSLARYTPRVDRAEARRRCRLPPEGPLVAYVGNIQLFKGMTDLIEVTRRIPAARFVVVGGSPAEVEILRTEAARLGVTGLITTGHKPAGAVADYLFAADVLFQPPTFGNQMGARLIRRWLKPRLPGVPFKLYSYLAAGRPIVAADQAINTELLTGGENALLFPPGDHDRAAAAVERLLAEPALARRLSEAARAEAERHTWEARARIMLDFFSRRLCALGGSAR